jgi:uncharacterized metal-binding protein YceD (DUF177 family)
VQETKARDAMTQPEKTPAFGPVLALADLARSGARDFTLEPAAEVRAAIADALEISEVRKLRFAGRLVPLEHKDWRLDATLGATVVQPCVVTLAPVTTRIDETVSRTWRADWEEPEGDEVELPEDVDQEKLGAEIDLGAVMVEALALSLPPWPRAEGVELGEAQFTEPGQTAMSDADAKPFAGLASLRDKLSKDGED